MMSNAILIFSAYMALANLSQQGLDTNLDIKLWESFKQENGKQYENQNVEAMRRTIFVHNSERIRQMTDANTTAGKEELGFEVGLNHLGDISELELKLSHKGFRVTKDLHRRLLRKQSRSKRSMKFLTKILYDDNDESTFGDAPDSLDWRQVPGRVSRVKNQGSCGSCWAFASTGALEGQEKQRRPGGNWFSNDTDNIVELSEQNLVDCVKKDYGCNGGIMADAFEFIHDEGGIDDELSYPYEGRTRKCRFRKSKVAMSDAGYVILTQGDEQKLKEVVARFGPVAVAIDASSFWFQFYKHGVYYDKHCKNKPDQLDHAVLVVGYGTDPKKGDYWLVKNSWGPKYGEQGYIRMSRNRNNNCGIASMATIPTF